jgi:DNA-binding winged helix-turn-helix (wHTH) protein/predicted ATPase
MIYAFEEYELDVPRYELRYAGKLVKLEPQVFNVLAYLLQHRDRVLTKEELLAQLWPGRFVSEATLTSRLTAARRAIGDRGREQRLIQTIHGRGYRFIAPVEERASEAPGRAMRSIPPLAHYPAEQGVSRTTPERPQLPSCQPLERASHDGPVALSDTVVPRSALRGPQMVQAVGREAELAQLHRWLQQALRGSQQLVFVTGEAGLGKTTLVETLLQQLGGYGALWVGHGQCIEHYGVGEAYLPILEALGGLCKESGGQELITLLLRQAPTWMVHMPWLVSDGELEALQRRVMGATQERMLREMAEALAALTAERPLILVLEDLHWSDPSTLDLIAWLARRPGPARLLVLSTYRPADATRQGHPLHAVVQELKLHKHGDELALALLTEAAVAAYLRARFPGTALPNGLARLVHQRTEGNPLFMVNVVDAWEAQGWLEVVEGRRRLRMGMDELAQGVPEGLRQMLAQQFERLSLEEQLVLEAASVAGVEFSAATVAAGLDSDVVEAETRCEGLARRQQWLRAIGSDEWPDGTVAGRYAFIHALYQQVAYQRLGASRRVHLHRQIGTRLQGAYGPRGHELAAELAEHFVRGRNAEKAVQYLQVAGAQAEQRSAHREALQHLTRGLELLAMLPETPARAQQELDLQIALGSVLIATKGPGAPEVEQTYARARALCQQIGEKPQLFPTLHGLCWFYRSRGALPTARELGEQLYQLAQRDADPTHRLEAHGALGGILFYLGEYDAARTHLEQGITLTDPTAQRALALRHGVAPGVRCLAVAAPTLWCLGYPAQAVRRNQEALALAQTLAHPYSLGLARHYATFLHHRRREVPDVQAQAEALLTLATAQGFPLWAGYGTCWRGWALAVQGQGEAGLAQMRQGLAALLATGQTLGRPFCLVILAEAAGHIGQAAEGLRLLAEALTAFEASGRGDMLAEAYRLQGELLLRQAGTDAAQAEACFHQALAIARRQQAKSWELRAAMSLSRLWLRQGRCTDAHQLLAPIYGWFTEGFDTADLQEAKALLDELA